MKNLPLLAASAVLAPVIAFAALWTVLLAMIAVSGLLHTLGLF